MRLGDFLGQINSEQISLIEKIANSRKIVVLPYENMYYRFSNGVYYGANQLEFVKLISEADYVFTDSFHGTAFSIMFGRQFMTFARSHTTAIEQTSRINSLLKILGIEKNYCKKPSEYENIEIVDYDLVNEKLEAMQKESRNFIDNALNDIRNKKLLEDFKTGFKYIIKNETNKDNIGELKKVSIKNMKKK